MNREHQIHRLMYRINDDHSRLPTLQSRICKSTPMVEFIKKQTCDPQRNTQWCRQSLFSRLVTIRVHRILHK
jgi:t-SNARE complex subunit (syntaxin)